MSVGLMMIVKNEAGVLPRLAASVQGKIDRWTIVDTGSEDETVEVVPTLFADVPGDLIVDEWKGFGPSRQVALEAAEGKTDWLLWLDADETLEGEIPDLEDLDCYEAEEWYFNLRYWKPYLIRSGRGWHWEGRAHEALTMGEAIPITDQTTAFHILHHADGGSRGEKYTRDMGLLLEDWKEEPSPRTAFYLARTYEDGGEITEAQKWYEVRLSMGGWEEEQFYSLYRLGGLSLPSDSGVGLLWRAWGMRTHRPEPLLALCQHYRLQSSFPLVWLCAHTALENYRTPSPSDLFCDSDAPWKIRYELSIAAWYMDQKILGRRYAAELMKKELPEPWQSSVRSNAVFYGVS
jgi:hypothetical protein